MLLPAFNDAFAAVKSGTATEIDTRAGHPEDTIAATLTSGKFAYWIRRDYLRRFREGDQ